MKKSNNFYIHIGIGIACFLVGASQIYRGLEPLDYLPIIVVGFAVIVSGYNGEKKNDSNKS